MSAVSVAQKGLRKLTEAKRSRSSGCAGHPSPGGSSALLSSLRIQPRNSGGGSAPSAEHESLCWSDRNLRLTPAQTHIHTHAARHVS